MAEEIDMSDAERAICPVCKSRQTDDFRDVREYHFQICAACRFVFLHPMPSEMVLESMYNTGGQITPDFYPKAKSRLHRALRIAMHLYRFAWRGRLGNRHQVGRWCPYVHQERTECRQEVRAVHRPTPEWI